MSETYSLDNVFGDSEDECDSLRDTFQFELEEEFVPPLKRQRLLITEEQYKTYLEQCCMFFYPIYDIEEEYLHFYDNIVQEFCEEHGKPPSCDEFKEQTQQIQTNIKLQLYNGEIYEIENSINLESYCDFSKFMQNITSLRRTLYMRNNPECRIKHEYRKKRNECSARRFRRMRDLYIKQLQQEIENLHSKINKAAVV